VSLQRNDRITFQSIPFEVFRLAEYSAEGPWTTSMSIQAAGLPRELIATVGGFPAPDTDIGNVDPGPPPFETVQRMPPAIRSTAR
jgi:hypothetical protein